MSAHVQVLERYRIDRADGATAVGAEKLIVLALKGVGEREVCFAISKIDVMIMTLQMQQAANEVQQEDHRS